VPSCLSSPHHAFPHPDLSPEDTLAAQLRALQDLDNPKRRAGLAIASTFAAPGTDPYATCPAALLDIQSFEILTTERDDDVCSIGARITTRASATALLVFALYRCTSPHTKAPAWHTFEITQVQPGGP
jgi:hypothetical protein